MHETRQFKWAIVSRVLVATLVAFQRDGDDLSWELWFGDSIPRRLLFCKLDLQVGTLLTLTRRTLTKGTWNNTVINGGRIWNATGSTAIAKVICACGENRCDDNKTVQCKNSMDEMKRRFRCAEQKKYSLPSLSGPEVWSALWDRAGWWQFFTVQMNDSCEIWTHAGDPNRFLVYRLNRSAKLSCTISHPSYIPNITDIHCPNSCL